MEKMTLPIHTQRIIIRKFEDGDAPDIVEYSLGADFWLSRNIGWDPTEEAVLAYYGPMRNIYPESYTKWLDLVIELKANSKVVGNVGIGFANGEREQAMVGCLLGCQYQGRGLASEALRALISFGIGSMGLHRIHARTGSLNTASWHLMERVGMKRETHFRRSHKVKDEWDDEFVYAVLADEWRLVQKE